MAMNGHSGDVQVFTKYTNQEEFGQALLAVKFNPFKLFKPLNPLLHPPPRRGGGKRWGLERSEALELLELLEQRDFVSITPPIHYPGRLW